MTEALPDSVAMQQSEAWIAKLGLPQWFPNTITRIIIRQKIPFATSIYRPDKVYFAVISQGWA